MYRLGVGFGIRSRKVPARDCSAVTVPTQHELEGENYELDGGIKFKSHANASSTSFHPEVTAAASGDPVITKFIYDDDDRE